MADQYQVESFDDHSDHLQTPKLNQQIEPEINSNQGEDGAKINVIQVDEEGSSNIGSAEKNNNQSTKRAVSKEQSNMVLNTDGNIPNDTAKLLTVPQESHPSKRQVVKQSSNRSYLSFLTSSD